MMTITREPQAMAVQQVAEDYPLRYDIATGAPTAEDAAMLAMSDLLDDGRDWECYVPANWEPDAWMETYRACYQEAWEAMGNDLQRVCATCYYCRMDTEAESVALYGRVLGYGTCYRHGGNTVKAPAEDTCADWWSPLAPTTDEEEG